MLKDEINIGIAVAIEEGIIVPVIRNVDRKGLRDVAREERAHCQGQGEGFETRGLRGW